MKSEKRTAGNFIEWIGFSGHPKYLNALWFGPILGAILLCLVAILIVASVVTLSHFLGALFGLGPYADDRSGESIRNIGLVLAALFGAPLLVWRSAVVARQTDIAAAALFNQKINDAAQALSARREVTELVDDESGLFVLKTWEDDLVTRVAAIDRLEGLTSEDADASGRIVRLLATYVRGNFSCNDLEPSENLETRHVPRMDLQKAVDAIGRVLELAAKIDSSEWRLDLKGCTFDGVDFSRGFFRAADFRESRFEGSLMREANFEGCIFTGALFNYAYCYNANMKGAKFDRIILNKPSSERGGYVRSLNQADIQGASFVAADISAISYLGPPKKIAQTFGTRDTVLSPQMQRRKVDSHTHDLGHLARTAPVGEILDDEFKAAMESLERTGFQNWSPYDSSDGVTETLRAEFYKELEMEKWPYY